MMIRIIPAGFQAHNRNLAERSPEPIVAGLARSLEELSLGLAALSSGGTVRWANSSFRTMLRQNPGLTIVGEVLRASDDHVASALAGLLVAHPRSDRVLRIAFRSLFIVRLHIDRSTPTPVTYVALSEAGWVLNETLLRVTFGLTPAECRIAQEIAAGAKPDEVARARALSPHTVRTHIKSVMAKIGVNSRAGLLCSLAPLGVLSAAMDAE